jgi:hypothetical protein
MVRKRVSEKNDCVGSFSDPKVELVLSLVMSICLFFGEVVGTEGGENACLLLQPRSSGLGSAKYDDGCWWFVWRSIGDGCWYFDRIVWLLVMSCWVVLIDRHRTFDRSYDSTSMCISLAKIYMYMEKVLQSMG